MVGVIGPIAIIAGVVAGLGLLKHPATLSPIGVQPHRHQANNNELPQNDKNE
ncbi:CapE family protein [Peribacillus simplex]|uniref:CapE family protein n=1 Tax=Peribacillus simplex TaxID=1478 RepID=UPI00288BCD19|nr:CapE family protein [Peribacillus simplex]